MYLSMLHYMQRHAVNYLSLDRPTLMLLSSCITTCNVGMLMYDYLHMLCYM